MMVNIEASIHRGSKVDMAASVYVDSVAGSVSSPTLLSSGAVIFVLLVKQTGQEAWVRVVRESVFRVLSGDDEVRALVSRLFPPGT